MASEMNRICPHCGEKMMFDTYEIEKSLQSIAYCDNSDCPVKPCTDATIPSKVYQEILAITGDEE